MATYDIKNPGRKPSPQDIIQQKMKEMPNGKAQKIEKKIKENPNISTPQTKSKVTTKKTNLLPIISLALVVLLGGGLALIYLLFSSKISSLTNYVQNQNQEVDLSTQDEKISVLEEAFNNLKSETEARIGDLDSDISGTEGFASKSDITNLENIFKEIDTDGDGLNDYEEVITYGTNPNLKDTDKDGFTDKQEVDGGFNPNGTGKLQETNNAEESTEEKKIVQITASDYVYNPSIIELSVGQTARIELTSLDNKYTFTIDKLNINEEIKPGEETIVELTPIEAGTYVFYSSNKNDIEKNMKGTLTVQAAK